MSVFYERKLLMIIFKEGFTAEEIPDKIWENMQGKTYHENALIGRKPDSYIEVFCPVILTTYHNGLCSLFSIFACFY